MSARIILGCCVLLLLICSNALAQKESGGQEALSTYCGACSYIVMDDSTSHAGQSTHTFKVNSNSLQVTQIEATFKIHTTGNVTYSINPLYTGYTSLTTDDYSDSTAIWINVQIYGIDNAVFADDAVFELMFSTDECIGIGEGFLIEVTDNPDISYYNFFYAFGEPNNAYTPVKNDGYQTMYDPEAVISVIGIDGTPELPTSCEGTFPGDANNSGSITIGDITFLIGTLVNHDQPPVPLQNGDPNGDCLINMADIDYLIDTLYQGGPSAVDCSCEEMPQLVDSAVLGGTVSVPIYLRESNFAAPFGWYFYLAHHAGLEALAPDPTSWSGNVYINPINDTLDMIYTSGTQGSTPPDMPELFLTANFWIDSAVADTGEYLWAQVAADTGYITWSCVSYTDTGFGDMAQVWVKVIADPTLCYDCNFEIGNDRIYYDVDTAGLKKSTQSFSFNSDGQQVAEIEVSLKVNSSEQVDFAIVSAYGAPTDTVTYSAGDAFWINLKWTGLSDVFTGQAFFDLELYTAECLSTTDTIHVEIIGNPAQAFSNRFKAVGGSIYQDLGALGAGYITMYDPVLVVSALGYEEPLEPDGIYSSPLPGDVDNDGSINISDVTYLTSFFFHDGPPPEPLQRGDVNGDCFVDINDYDYLVASIYQGGPDPVDSSCAVMPQLLDSNVVGGEVEVPIYLRDVNFDYGDQSVFVLKIDPRLDVIDYIPTSLLPDPMVFPDDTSVTVLYLNGMIDHTETLPAVIGTVILRLSPGQTTEGRFYPVGIDGPYFFTGCDDYVGSGDGDIATAWVKATFDSTICYDCLYALADDSVFYDVDAAGLRQSDHLFSFDSDSQQVAEIEVTLRVATTETVEYSIVNVGHGSPTESTSSDSTGYWINLVWTNVGGTVFAGDSLFGLTLKTAECLASGESIAIEIAENTALGYINTLKRTGDAYYQDVIVYDPGSFTMLPPALNMSLMTYEENPTPPETCEGTYPGDANSDGHIDIADHLYLLSFLNGYNLFKAPDPFQNGDANGDCLVDTNDVKYLIAFIFTGGPPPVPCSCDETKQILDSALVGETVSVPVYLRDINFDYRNGCDFTIKFDPALTYDTITTTSFAAGITAPTETDTTLVFHLGSNLIDHPPVDSLPAELLSIHFTLPTGQSNSGRFFPVVIDGDYVFIGCEDYADTGNGDRAQTWVKARWDYTAYCPHCDFDISDDSVYHEVDTLGLRQSDHYVTLNSDGQEVTEIEVSVQLNTAATVDFLATSTGFGVPTTSSHTDGVSTWLNFTLSGLGGAIFADDTLFHLTVLTDACVAPGDSITYDFVDLPAQGFENTFKEDSTNYVKSVVRRFAGYEILRESALEISLLGTGQSSGQIIDSSYGSTPLSVPIYVDDINFDYGFYGVWVKWDVGLVFDSVAFTTYSAESSVFPELVSQVTDSILIYDNNFDFMRQHSEVLPEELASVWFSIDTMITSPADVFRVYLNDEPVFFGCSDYGDTSLNIDDHVYLLYSDSNIVVDAAIALTDDSVHYDGGYGWVDFYNTFSFDSDSRPVETIEATFKIHSESVYFARVDGDTTFSGHSVTVTKTEEAPYYWVNVEISDLNGEVFAGEPLFTVMARTSECRAAYDSIQIEFDGYPSLGYTNHFVDSAGVTKSFLPIHQHDGYLWFLEANAAITLLPVGAIGGDLLDSSYVGGVVSVPVYFDTIDFDYTSGFSFDLAFDPALEFHSIGHTPYSQGPINEAVESNVTDSTLTISAAYSMYDGMRHPTESHAVLCDVNFTFDPTLAEPDTEYEVRLVGDYIFSACSSLQDGDTAVSESAYYKTVKEVAGYKFGTLSVGVGSTETYKLYFYMKNTAPIATDIASDSVVFARFAFDSTSLTYSHYAGISTGYPYGNDTLFWMMETFAGDTTVAEESHIVQSEMIDASYDWVKIGYFLINIGSTAGIDPVNFVSIVDTLHTQYMKDNFAVFKYTGDTVRYVDSVTSDSTYYGDLELVAGSISVTEGGDPPAGCPMLYSWDGQRFVMEDFILTQSDGNLDPIPSDDYYPIEGGTVDEDGMIRLRISEFENEITYLDQVELISVDYPMTSKVGISNKGKVYTYRQSYTPIACVDEAGNDLLPLLSGNDDSWFEAYGPGSMTVTYNNPSFGKDATGFALEFGDEGGTIKKGSSNDPATDDESPIASVAAEIEDVDGNWHSLGVIPPRKYLSENCTFFFDDGIAVLGSTFRVHISWEQSFRADIQELCVDDGSLTMQRLLAPRQADHTVAGRITRDLSATDQEIVTLKPGQDIDLKFLAPERFAGENYARKYFIKTHGFFRTVTSSDLLPDRYELDHNYPNPFNPTTNIGFSVPVAGKIHLAVYNVLGQEVRTLVDGTVEAGRHQVLWHGDTNAGKRAASGVYFYRLRAQGFEQSRKMTLLK